MRRENPISVRIRAPSRGLVTRYPSESADQFRAGDYERTSVVAQNVRYEDGVIRNSPGYSTAELKVPVLETLVAHYRMDDPSLPGVRIDSTANHYDLMPSQVIIPGNVSSNGLGAYTFTAGSAHGLVTGDIVSIAGLILQANGNGAYTITVTSSTTFIYNSQPSGSTVTESGIASGTPIDINAVFQDAGKINKAIHWNGVPSHYATFQSAIPALFSGNFSVGFWFNQDLGGAAGFPLIMAPGFQITSVTGTSLRFQVWNGSSVISVDTPSTISSGTWYFVTFVYDNTAHTITAYLNTTASTPVSTTTGLAAHFSSFFSMGNNAYLSGFLIDSMSVWNGAITSGEVAALVNSGSGLDYPFQAGPYTLLFQGNLIGSVPNPLIGATGGDLQSLARSFDNTTNAYELTPTTIFTGNFPSTSFPWLATDFFNVDIFAQHDNIAQYWDPSTMSTRALPGLPVLDDMWDGTEAFFGHVLLWKDDRLKWSDRDDYTNWIPVGTTASSFIMTVASGGFTQPSPGGTVTINVNENPVTLGAVVGQFIFIQDIANTGQPYYNYYQITGSITTSSFQARLQDLTGVTPAADTISASSQILSLDANEAGETRVVGSKMNGEIFRVVAMGDYAYIFKERSIQSVQYVGPESGTFFIHPEVSDEGLLSRTAVLNLGDGRIIFMGHKELYLYTGGPQPKPVATQFTRQLIREIDRTRLQDIVMTHKETRHEVWVTYPIIGGQKTLVWNYFEDSASIDVYDPALGGITASADVDFSTDPPWLSLPDSLTWENMDGRISWLDMSNSSNDRILLLGVGDGQILVWGVTPARDPFPGSQYVCLSETMDFDLGEPDIFKYVDVVAIGLEILSDDSANTRLLYIQVGQRAGLGQSDNDIVWTAPTSVSTAGDQTYVVKVNPGGAGRYLRLRFYTQDSGVQFAISSFEIHCRPGGLY